MAVRGCGERVSDGLYLVCRTGSKGIPFDNFLICSPVAWQGSISEIVNKVVPWPRKVMNRDGELETVILNGKPVYDVLIWVGAEHYNYAPLFIEEGRRLGFSRRVPKTFDFSKLTPGISNMVFVHPRALVSNWQDYLAPEYCPRNKPGHVEDLIVEAMADPDKIITIDSLLNSNSVGQAIGLNGSAKSAKEGPCLGTLYNLLPDNGLNVTRLDEGYCQWTLPFGSGFMYRPIKNNVEPEYKPGIFGMFPIHGLEYVTPRSGMTDEGKKSQQKIQKAGFDFRQVDF
jgi:hypothetical protein